MRTENPRGLYRSRRGILFGVCRGLADYFDIRVVWVRVFSVVAALVTTVWPVIGLYILAALLMKPEPAEPIADPGEREFYDAYVTSRGTAVERLKRKFDGLNRRIERLEHVVTSREYDWQRRFGR